MPVTEGPVSLETAFAPRYAIEGELGRGGMATVYLAADRKLHRRVALKVLHPDAAATLGPERFQREIAIAARLTHPHILPLYDSGEADGRLFYAMPYIEGESLRERLRREPQLPVAEAVRIVTAVASALDYAHQAGVIHRDIKPENILLAPDPGGGPAQPLVADFGLARAMDAAGGERLTETGLVLGTPAYMSPEQGSAGGRIDGRSDLYALGCVAYEMLAGAPPFMGPTAQAILSRHAVDPVPPLRTVRATIPEAVAYAIERALAKVPADRFATAAEFAEALITEHVPAARRRPRRATRRASILAVAGLGVVCVGFFAWLLRRSSAPTVVPSASRIVVLPFVAELADTGLTRLGRDLAVTVSASLDRVGGLETADRLIVANATAERVNLSAAEGAALARRLGASSVLRGTLVRAGAGVRLDAGLYATKGLAPLAEGMTVTAPIDSVGTLTDSIAWALLRHVWQRGEPPSPSLAAVTTRSLPALRAFLDGERELGANDWDGAALAYQSAFAADSNFHLARFRYALVQAWREQPLEPEALATLRAHRDVFPERERLMVDAFFTDEDSLGLRIERHRLVTQRFPDYWPGWVLYGDILTHAGPMLGHDWSEGLAAFQRAVALNPKLVPAWVHILMLTIGRDEAEASRAMARLADLSGGSLPFGPRARLLYQLSAAIGRGAGRLPPNAAGLADSLAELMPSTPDPGMRLAGYPLRLLEEGYPAAQLDLNHRALRLANSAPDLVAALEAANAYAWAARGQWDSALATMRKAAMAHPGPLAVRNQSLYLPVESYGLAVLGAWLGTIGPELASERRPAAAAAILRLSEPELARGQLAWLDGLLGFVRRDRRAIQAARGDASRSGHFQADLIDRSLAAFDRALAGDRMGAARDLVSISEHEMDQKGGFDPTVPDMGVQRLAAAEWLRGTADEVKAVRLLRWQEAWQSGWIWTSADVLGGPTYLARARLEEAGGDPRRAQEYYHQFLRRYDQPMPSQVHLVEEARAALARAEPDR